MKILLVIDVQKEFYKENKQEKIINFINKNNEKFDKVIATFFVNYKDSNFNKVLNFKECFNSDFDSIEFKYDYCIPKYTYSLDITELISRGITEEDTIYIIGCDSDACIMATCFTLFDKGYNFKVISNYIYTSSKDFSDEDVFKILKRNFGRFII